MASPELPQSLSYRETLYELRRTRKLYEDERITVGQWCESVHRIVAAFKRGRAARA